MHGTPRRTRRTATGVCGSAARLAPMAGKFQRSTSTASSQKIVCERCWEAKRPHRIYADAAVVIARRAAASASAEDHSSDAAMRIGCMAPVGTRKRLQPGQRLFAWELVRRLPEAMYDAGVIRVQDGCLYPGEDQQQDRATRGLGIIGVFTPARMPRFAFGTRGGKTFRAWTRGASAHSERRWLVDSRKRQEQQNGKRFAIIGEVRAGR